MSHFEKGQKVVIRSAIWTRFEGRMGIILEIIEPAREERRLLNLRVPPVVDRYVIGMDNGEIERFWDFQLIAAGVAA